MRILLPSIVDPRTHHGGAGAATRGLLSLLQRPPLAADVDVVAPSSPLPHVVRQLIAVTRSSRSSWPSKALFLDTRGFRRAIGHMVATRRYDLVLINGGDLLWMLPLLPRGVPRVLYAHNLERDLFAAQLDHLPAPLSWARGRLGRDLDKLRACELGGMRDCERVLFISATDQAQARTEAGSLRTLHLPPLFDYEPPARARRTQLRGTPHLGFLANFTWWPNRAAARWLLQDVLPHVTRDLRVHLFGDGSTNIAHSDPRVIAHGFVDDVTEVFASCDVMLCPTVSGAGVNVKFAEALYNGVPVLATPRAARGLPLPIDAGVVLADGAKEWVRLLGGEGLERLAARQLARTASRPFDPATHAAAVHQFLRSAVAGEDDTARVAPESGCARSH